MDMINFGTAKVICRPTHLADGTPVAAPTPVVLGVLQDVSVSMSVDIKTLYGGGMYPVAVAQGKGKLEMKAKTGKISGAVLGALFLGQNASAGIKDCVNDFLVTVPTASPYTIAVAPPSVGTFVEDLGVFDAYSGEQLINVVGAPAVNQYNVTGLGVYTFASADATRALKLNYEFSANSASAQLFAINNRQMGYTPSFSVLLKGSYDGKSIIAKFYRGVSGKLDLPFKSEDFTVSDFEAQFFANAADNVGWICLR